MDPITAVSLAAGATQFVDIGGRALLGVISLLRDLKDIPKWISDLLDDVEKSLKDIDILQETVNNSASTNYSQLSASQVQSARERLKDASDAIADLKSVLEPYSQSSSLRTHGMLRKTWIAMASIAERSKITQKIERVLLLNQDVSRALQVIQLEKQNAIA